MGRQNRLLCFCMALLLFLSPLRAWAESPSADLLPAGETVSAGFAEKPVPGLSEGEMQDQEEAEEPVIQVSVPDTGQVILNPYGLKVEVGGREMTGQVLSGSYTLKNESEIPVVVWARAVGSVPPESEASFSAEPPEDGTEEKQAFVYAEFCLKEGGEWSDSYTGAGHQLVVSEVVQDFSPVLTLPEGTDGEFRFFGSTSVPSAQMWTAEDTVDVSIVFSFTADDGWAEPERP